MNAKSRKKVKGIRVPEYKIPKHIFKKTLAMIQENEVDELWDARCHTPVHLISDRKYEPFQCSFTNILSLCRTCLLARDWDGLAKSLSTPRPRKSYDLERFFPTYLKFATILLKHKNNPEPLDILLNIVCPNKADRDEFWKSMSQI